MVEHPTGFFTVQMEVDPLSVRWSSKSALLRTARMLMSGEVMIPARVWTEEMNSA